MPSLPWPEWLPDQADFNNAGSPLIKNCVPLTQKSYGPMPTYVPWADNALAERCQGFYSVKSTDGSVYMFAGDRTKLYMATGGSRTLADVSKAGGYTTPSISGGGAWAMTSYGARILATNGSDPIQTLLTPVGATPVFSDLSADAPQAKYIAVVKDFVMVGNTIDGTDGPRPNRIWWSAINNPEYWPVPGSVEGLQTMSDYQDLQQTDLGAVTGLSAGFAQGSDVVILCERGIWTAAFVGPPLIFNIRVALGAAGTMAPLSIVQSFARDNAGAIRPVIYYLASNGFAAFDGSTSYPIGAQKFDRRFFAMLDDAHLNYVQGATDPRTRSVMWAFATPGSNGLATHILVYNWEIGRAVISELEDPANQMEWMGQAMFGAAYHLDNIDTFGDLEVIQPPFDDPFWSGSAALQIAAFPTSHILSIGNGPAMAPTLETTEMQPAPGRRSWVSMTRPLVDGGAATIAVGHRERLTDPVTWEPAVPVDEIGNCPQRSTGRYVRFRMQMPKGESFRHLQGIDLTLIPEGERR